MIIARLYSDLPTPHYSVGDVVRYVNGSETEYLGEIKEVRPFGKSFSYVIIGHTDKAAVELWNAGYAIGSCIQESQIIAYQL